MKGRPRRALRPMTVLWYVDLAIIVLAVIGAANLRFSGDPEGHMAFLQNATGRALLVGLALTGSMAMFGLYQVHLRPRTSDLVLRIVLAFVFGSSALLVLYYAFPPAYIGRGVLAITLLLSLVSAVVTRMAAARLFEAETFKRRVLVLGAGDNAHIINDRLRRRSDRAGFTLVGFVPLPGQKVSVDESMLVRPVNGILALAEELNVAELVVALDERRGALPMEEMLICAQRGLHVTDLSSFFEREAGMVSLSVSDPSWLVFSGGFDHSLPRRLSKRFFDVVAAMSLLLVSWPVMAIVALCVKLESPGPVLYRQVRVGELGQEFELVKFRSMRVDAEADGVARWASTQDDRSTRVGKFIRKVRLDELPQLINVLRGEMSFVGPRPERPQFVSMLAEQVRYYNVRHSIKPGLTGWAQVRYPYGASVSDAEEKLKFDLFYVKNHGLLLDVLILMQTIEVVLFQRGGR